MRAIKSKDSIMEKRIRSELWKKGYRFRKHYKQLQGNPDIVFVSKKVAVFFDSCFWHGCAMHCRMPMSNVDYWLAKIERNRRRDRKVTRILRFEGWKVIRIWEHEIKNNIEKAISKIEKNLK